METLKRLSKRKFLRKEMRNTIVSSKLDFEIKKTQELLGSKYKNKYKRKKKFTRIQASDFLAEIFRKQRYKLEKA